MIDNHPHESEINKKIDDLISEFIDEMDEADDETLDGAREIFMEMLSRLEDINRETF